MTKEENISEK